MDSVRLGVYVVSSLVLCSLGRAVSFKGVCGTVVLCVLVRVHLWGVFFVMGGCGVDSGACVGVCFSRLVCFCVVCICQVCLYRWAELYGCWIFL